MYKLYIHRFKEDIDIQTHLEGFYKFYSKHKVSIIGNWSNISDPQEVYLITGYRNQQHYEEFIKEIKRDKEYLDLTEKLSVKRQSITVKTLGQNYAGQIKQSVDNLLEYIQDAKKEFLEYPKKNS